MQSGDPQFVAPDAAHRPFDPRVIWALPAAFVVHDAEELLTMPSWLAANRQTLHAMLQEIMGATAEPMIETPNVGIGVAMLALLAVFIIGAACVTLMPTNRIALFAYLVLLGAFFVHGFTHIGQSAIFGGYTPGVVTAALVVIPASLYLYRQFRRHALVSRAALVSTACIGAALIVPGILIALAAGREATG